MSKGAVITLFILAVTASMLLGINTGMRLENSKGKTIPPTATPIAAPSPSPTTIPSPSPLPLPTLEDSTESASVQGVTVSSYTDKTCGFSVEFNSSYFSQSSENGRGTIITDPDDKSKYLAFACLEKIPRPPVSSENIESVILDGVPATLFHDKEEDQAPKEIIIVENRNKGLEIIMAGTGEIFKEALESFRFTD